MAGVRVGDPIQGDALGARAVRAALPKPYPTRYRCRRDGPAKRRVPSAGARDTSLESL